VHTARAGGRYANTKPAGELGISTSHKCGGFLMPDLNEANLILPFAKGFDNAVYAIPWQAEYGINSPIYESFDDYISCCFSHDYFEGLQI
jgi:hypothetical protein